MVLVTLMCTVCYMPEHWRLCVIVAISSSVSDDSSKVSNLQRVMTYCNQQLPSAVCHMSLADLLYCTDELRQNIVTFLVDLFDSLETVLASGGSGGSGGGGRSLMTS